MVDLTKLKPGMRCRMTNGETPVCESCEFDEDRNLFYITWASKIRGRGEYLYFDSFNWWYLPDGTWHTVNFPGNDIEEILAEEVETPVETVMSRRFPDIIASVYQRRERFEVEPIKTLHTTLWAAIERAGDWITEQEREREAADALPEMEKECASRHNKGKLEWFRLPFDCLEDVVRVMMNGNIKDPDDPVDDTGRGKPNWSKDGTPYTEFAESCQRHLLAWRNGEDTDSESGHPHLAHMIAGALFLMYYQKYGKGVDDRLRSRGL